MISIIIPTLSRGEQEAHFSSLNQLLTTHLPHQSHSAFEAIILSDGPNNRVANLVSSLKDDRMTYYATSETRQWGHPQTREGIRLAQGDFFVRMNDDNIPYPNYLRTLQDAFDADTDISYARVKFKSSHRASFNRWYKLFGLIRFGYPFIMPKDLRGRLQHQNIDCMNYMVRMNLARSHIDAWTDDCNADWQFLDAILTSGARAKFVNKVIGEKY